MTFTKGEWTKVIDDDVTVLDSNPINKWPKTYTCCDSIEKGCNYALTLNENGTLKIRTTDVDWSDTGKYTYDGNNNWFFDFNNSLDANASGNYEKLNIDTGITSWGNQSYVSCSLNK